IPNDVIKETLGSSFAQVGTKREDKGRYEEMECMQLVIADELAERRIGHSLLHMKISMLEPPHVSGSLTSEGKSAAEGDHISISSASLGEAETATTVQIRTAYGRQGHAWRRAGLLQADVVHAASTAVVGGINEDMVFTMRRAPGPGESCPADSMTKYPGGKGANIAMAACRARDSLRVERGKASDEHDGAHTDADGDNVTICLNGAVGADEPGARLLEHLKRGGVDVSRVQLTDGEATPTGIVMLETSINDSRSFAYHGAMSSWRITDPSTTACLTSGDRPDLIVAKLTAPQEEVLKVFAAAAKEGVPTLFNPSPIQEIERAIFANVTHLIVNESKAMACEHMLSATHPL
ncbi:hypothetical protein B0A48_00992, partial [Cryoendolithus antarcticus]